MSVTQHGDYLFKLTRFWIMNSYLVREEDGVTVIDTGMPGSTSAIMQIAKDMGQPIKRILLTHGHLDHTGSLDELVEAVPGVELLIGERTAACMGGDLSNRPGEPQKPLKGGFPARKSKPTRLIEAGDRIGSLEVHASPGHTPGHLAFFDTRDKTLIAGDAWQTQGGVAVVGDFNILFPLPYFATWDQATALESGKRLRDLKPERLAVGHGLVVDQPLTQMEQGIKRFEKRLA